MEQIIIRRPGKADLPLFRHSALCTVTRATQTRKLLGEDTLTLNVESVDPLDISVGDSILAFGVVYTLNRLPTATKNGDRRFVYELTFEGPQYSLFRVLFLNEDSTGFSTGPDFTLTGDLAMFAQVLLTNINRVLRPAGSTADAWLLGDVPNGTPTKTLSFNGENGLAVLQKLCSEFGTEFTIVRKATAPFNHTLHFGQQGQLLGHTFEYGRGNGLYNLSRQTITNEDFVTRLYAYGGNKNIPSAYRDYSSRLRMDTPGSYLEAAAAKQAFGLIEGTKVFEDIYPHRTGVITGIGALVSGVKSFTVTDNTMDFDLSQESGPAQKVNGKDVKQYTYLIGGVAPKFHIQTGGLAGYEFEITSYDHASKTFTLISFQDERGIVFPSPTSTAFQFQPGDTYVLLDLLMPPSYVTAAEAELTAQAEAYLDQHSAPRVQYSLSIDEIYLSRLALPVGGTLDSIPNFFALGDGLHMKDADLAVDGASRIIGLSRDVLNPFKYVVEIAETYQISLIERILKDQADFATVVRINDLRDSNRARQGWRTTQELLNAIFDPDDYFDGGRIKPSTVETQMLVVGAKSQQFILNCVIEPNYEGEPNVVFVNAGRLTHYTIEETIRTWQIKEESVTLTSTGACYIYARCNRTNYSDAGLLFSTQQIKPGDNPTYYHFLLGVLHSVDADTGVRWINLTYGATAINGRFIKTGRIQSFDGLTWFDLDSGEVSGKITFLAADGTRKDVSTLESDERAFIDSVVADLPKQTDNKIVSWFASIPPNTWDATTRTAHEGDTWLNTTTKKLYRYLAVSNVWVANTNQQSVAAHLLALSRDVLTGKFRQTFGTANPTAPYNIGDFWVNGQTLLRCITARTVGQSFSALHWAPITHYDDTVTTIDGGVVTSGRIQLAGSGGSILAGITGEGTVDTSVRFWAGATYENRHVAPFRALQSGELFARKRIEMMNPANVGQAGICGANTYSDGGVRIWAGTPYVDRDTAPFRVTSDGSVTATKGTIGRWVISGDGIVNDDGQAYIIARTGTGTRRTEARIGANVFPATFGGRGAAQFVATQKDSLSPNYAAVFQADGGSENYAIYAQWGTSHLGEALLNGRKYLGQAINNVSLLVDPSKYDVIELYPTGTSCGLKFITPSSQLRYGKEITVMLTNDSFNNFRFYDIIRGNASYQANGGMIVTLIYTNGFWYVKSQYDNNFGAAGAPFVALPPLNPAPKVANPYPDQTINTDDLATFSVPISTFSDPGDRLTYGALSNNGSALPTGISFNRSTLTYTVQPGVAAGTYDLKTIAVDSDNQTISDSFRLTVIRPGLPPVQTTGNTYATGDNNDFQPS